MGDKDLKWAIGEVMSKSKNSLVSIAMGDPDSGEFQPVSSHTLTFDSQQAQLEPVYYWVLDFMKGLGWDMDKIVDNFTASPGSGQFERMSTRATKMQEEGMKILGGLNQVVKSVLNLIYDLKEFELRLEHYDDAHSEDKEIKKEGILALKQIWLDNVDLKRGRGSIHQMAAEMGFTTIREVFMIAGGQEDLKKMNEDEHGGLINDQVMRILSPRISEFNKWVGYSENELRKRFRIEKNYLKSQVETIKLYSGWMKPYFTAAEDLRQKGFDNNSALVNAFSTSMFELQLLGSKSVKADAKFGNYKSKRDYNQVIIIKLEYRGHLSQQVTQKGDYGFAMGGKIDITFDSFALNDEELATAKKLLEDESISDGLSFSADVAGDALDELRKDLDHFLLDKEEKELESSKEKEKKNSQDINPFTALFGGKKKKKKPKDEKEEKEIVPAENISKDNYVEKTMRAEAIEGAASKLYLVYDIYKKSHGMASSPKGFDEYDAEVTDSLGDGGDVTFISALKGRNAN